APIRQNRCPATGLERPAFGCASPTFSAHESYGPCPRDEDCLELSDRRSRTRQETIQSWNLAAVNTYPCKRSGRNPAHDCSEPFVYNATTVGACRSPSVFVTYLYASSSCSMLMYVNPVS